MRFIVRRCHRQGVLLGVQRLRRRAHVSEVQPSSGRHGGRTVDSLVLASAECLRTGTVPVLCLVEIGAPGAQGLQVEVMQIIIYATYLLEHTESK